ncbi:BMP family protein [Vibrio sp. CK2-1]|uniref:BMP family protein n=1 Tax=Vibrio sp. CK2-1 TaxID=2912249 RepID=UPI001F36262A|nr:BMP family protein [Vibrio sp. CK2-1]MCF7355232.1 BMP family protein [Vibrio sp. CK2-1]
MKKTLCNIGITLSVLFSSISLADDKTNILVFIPGNHQDNGFMEAAYHGYEKISNELDVNVTYISNISSSSDRQVLTDALRKKAEDNPDLIIAHGGQSNLPVQEISKEFSGVDFVVIQGNTASSNVSSYVVKQEYSTWLAGALAGMVTKTNKVGHISGAWPMPGIIGRGAFYNGMMYVNPDVEFISTFTGDLDNKEINQFAAKRQIDRGADIIFTMLNGGRVGVIDEVKASNGVTQIGNVSDWTTYDQSFIGSAVADTSVAVFNAANDYVTGQWTPNKINEIALDSTEVVKLTVSDSISLEVKDKLKKLQQDLSSGEIAFNTEYTGPEFDPKTDSFVNQNYKKRLISK